MGFGLFFYFAALEAEKYIWHVDNLDTFNEEFDSAYNLKFTEGSKLLNDWEDQDVFACFGEFIAYPIDGDRSPDPAIDTWEQFMSSPAQIVVLICDSFYYDFYIKDPAMTERFSQFISNLGIVPELIDHTDARYKLHVW